jgi:hypothetical protein
LDLSSVEDLWIADLDAFEIEYKTKCLKVDVDDMSTGYTTV